MEQDIQELSEQIHRLLLQVRSSWSCRHLRSTVLSLRPLPPPSRASAPLLCSNGVSSSLLQPVHSNGSMGLCSMGSNASHEQFLSIASSSDSNGVPNEEAQAVRPVSAGMREASSVSGWGRIFRGGALRTSGLGTRRPIPQALSVPTGKDESLDIERPGEKRTPKAFSVSQASVGRASRSCTGPKTRTCAAVATDASYLWLWRESRWESRRAKC